MPSKCPKAPSSATSLDVQVEILKVGTKLVRFQKVAVPFPLNSFNPSPGKDWTKPEDGARFNPFPGDPSGTHIPTLYCADTFRAAALESVFHALPHEPNPRFLRSQLADWHYVELETGRDLTMFRLTNPELRQLQVPGRSESLDESEIVHTLAEEYPNTRTWARYLYLSLPGIDGLAWRPRLGGSGSAFVLFGTRCPDSVLRITDGPIQIHSGVGFDKIDEVRRAASIRLVNS